MSFWDSVSDVLGTSGRKGVGLLQQKPEDIALAGLAGYGAYAALPYLTGANAVGLGAGPLTNAQLAAGSNWGAMAGAGGGGGFVPEAIANTVASGASGSSIPSWLTSAPALQAGASLVGGVLQSNALQQGARTQSDAAQRAIDLQERINQQQTALNAPFYSAGVTGQNRLLDLLGLSGNKGATGYGKYAKDFSMGDFQADPGYAFRLSEGQKALERSAAARGGLISGGAMKAATRYGQDMGSQEYQNAYNRYQTNRANQLNPLGSLTQSGQSAANFQAGNLGSYGANVGNLIGQQGQSQAAGQIGMGSTIGNAINTGISAYQNDALLEALRRQ
jgi:hypothetical protein